MPDRYGDGADEGTGRPGGANRPRRRDSPGGENGQGRKRSSDGSGRAGRRGGRGAAGRPERSGKGGVSQPGRGRAEPSATAQGARPGQRDSSKAPAGGESAGERDLPVDEDITGDELEADVLQELGSLSKGAARAVARHLVMAGRLLEEDPELAYRHSLEARRRAARVGVVREAAGVAAYMAGRYADALSELRAARRITGSAEYLPMMADCERGLGRPRRALDLASDPASTGLALESRIEMLIVAAGARRDLGDVDAAVVSLQVPELRSDAKEQWVARLRYAYADLLEAAGRREEAKRWFVRALDADREGDTDAADRVTQLDDRMT